MMVPTRSPRLLIVADPSDSTGPSGSALLLGALNDGWDARLIWEPGGGAGQGGPSDRRRRLLDDLGPTLVHSVGLPEPEWILLARRRGAGTLISVSGELIAWILEAPDRYRAAFAAADAVHVERPALVDVLSRLGIRNASMFVIPPDPAGGRFDVEPAPVRPAPPVRLLSIAPLSWSSGFEHSLAAVRLLLDRGLDCRYRIVGAGPHRTALAFARHRLGLIDQVELLEPGVRAPAAHLRWAHMLLDAGVAPGPAGPVMHAHAAGLPVVSSAPPEEGPATALSVPPLDADAIAGAVLTIWQDAKRREQLITAGRQRLLARSQARGDVALRSLQRDLLLAPHPRQAGDRSRGLPQQDLA